MWTTDIPVLDLLIRAALVYAFLLIALRLTGKRQVGQLAPFDLVLLLVLSNSLQNATNGGDNSLVGGIILAATLIVLNWIVGYVTFRSKRLESVIEGRPLILVHHGRVNRRAMRAAQMTIHELNAALRAEGNVGPEEVMLAVMETNGHITVIPEKHPPTDQPPAAGK